MKYIIIIILITTSTYALAELKSTYKILFNKNTKEIKILSKTNPTKQCDQQLKDKSKIEMIEKAAKKSKETWVKARYTCIEP